MARHSEHHLLRSGYKEGLILWGTQCIYALHEWAIDFSGHLVILHIPCGGIAGWCHVPSQIISDLWGSGTLCDQVILK